MQYYRVSNERPIYSMIERARKKGVPILGEKDPSKKAGLYIASNIDELKRYTENKKNELREQIAMFDYMEKNFINYQNEKNL